MVRSSIVSFHYSSTMGTCFTPIWLNSRSCTNSRKWIQKRPRNSNQIKMMERKHHSLTSPRCTILFSGTQFRYLLTLWWRLSTKDWIFKRAKKCFGFLFTKPCSWWAWRVLTFILGRPTVDRTMKMTNHCKNLYLFLSENASLTPQFNFKKFAIPQLAKSFLYFVSLS